MGRGPIYVTKPLQPKISALNWQLRKIYASGRLTNGGAAHEELEMRLTPVLGVNNLALFNNGTTALMTALRTMRVTGHVITTPFTFPATVQAITWAGATPVFVDVDESMNIDPNRIEDALRIYRDTSAIVPVHVFGLPCAVDDIRQIAAAHGMKVVYDGAHAFGTEISDIPIGCFGDATMYSFHATKLFHTVEGGAATFLDPDDALTARRMRNFGMDDGPQVYEFGLNGKMSEFHAAVGLEVLKMYRAERHRRIKLAAIYRERLANIPGITIPEVPANVRPSLQYFPIRVHTRRDEVILRLAKYDVFPRPYFWPLASDGPSYRDLPSAGFKLAVARRISQESLCLPFYGDLLDSEAWKIGDLIAGVME